MRAPLAFFLLIIALGAAASAAQETGTMMAPFGLTWGMSTDQVRALGIELAEIDDKSLGASYTATKVPKVLADAGSE